MAHPKLSDKEFHKQLEEAQKNPNFKKEINKFIKMATSVYRLKDFKVVS